MSFNSSETVSSSVAARGGLPGDFSQDSLQTYTRITIPKNSVLYDGSLVSRAAARWNCQTNYGPNPKKEGAFPETQSSSSSSAAKDWLEEENARVLQMWNVRSLDDEEDSSEKSPSFADVFTSSSAASRALASLEASKESQFHYWEQRSRQLDQALSSSTSKNEKLELEAPSVEIEIPVEVFGEDYALANEVLDQINRSGDDFSYITKDNVMLVVKIADYFLNERLLDACDGVLADMIQKLDVDAPKDVIKTIYEIIHPSRFQKPILEKARGSLARFFSRKLVEVANQSHIKGTPPKDGLKAYIKSLKEEGVQILELDFSWIPNLKEDHLIWMLEELPGLAKLDLSSGGHDRGRDTITDRIGKSLEGLTNLTHFTFLDCERLTDEIGKSLAKLSKLEELVLRDAGGLTDEFGQYLKALSNLKILMIDDTWSFTDKISRCLGELRNLEVLRFAVCPKLTDEFFESLKELPKLTCVYFYSPQWTDKIGNHLKKFPKLKSLSLPCCQQLTDKFIESLKLLPDLKYIDLTDCKGLKGETLKSLKLLSGLEGVNLSLCKGLKGGIVKDLADLPQLEFLGLYDCCDELREEIGSGLNSFPNLNLLLLDKLPKQLQTPNEKLIISTASLADLEWFDPGPIREFLARRYPDCFFKAYEKSPQN